MKISFNRSGMIHAITVHELLPVYGYTQRLFQREKIRLNRMIIPAEIYAKQIKITKRHQKFDYTTIAVHFRRANLSVTTATKLVLLTS